MKKGNILFVLTLLFIVVPFVVSAKEDPRDCGFYNCKLIDSIENDFAREHRRMLKEMEKMPRIEKFAFHSNVKFKTNDNNYQIFYELPGVDEEKINIEYSNRILTVKANDTKTEEKNKKNNIEYSNYITRFSNSMRIPEDADENTIKASHKNGLLIITINRDPKKVEKNVRKIEINKVEKAK